MTRRLPAAGAGRPVTGRSVLIMLLAFFGLVMIVNAVMIRAAVSTFGGVDTPSSYRAGLEFGREEAAAVAQRDLGWQVEGRIESAGGTARTLTVEVRDRTGEPVPGVAVTAVLAHPVDARRDVAFAMSAAGHGRHVGTGEADAGQWRLDIDVIRDGERLFRSRNRVSLRPAAP